MEGRQGTGQTKSDQKRSHIGGVPEKALKDPIYGIDKKSFKSPRSSPTVELGHALETQQDMFLHAGRPQCSHKLQWILKVAPGQPDTPHCKKDRILL
jgi:hypothetical protein